MAPSRSAKLRGLNTLTRKISYKKMPRYTIVVGLPREYLSTVYRGKEIN